MMINERGLTLWSCYAFDMALIYGFTDTQKKKKQFDLINLNCEPMKI